MIPKESFQSLARVRKATHIANILHGKFSANDVVDFTPEQRRMAERIAGVRESSMETWGIVVLILREQA
jgi:hypothetical protein